MKIEHDGLSISNINKNVTSEMETKEATCSSPTTILACIVHCLCSLKFHQILESQSM